MCTSIEDLGDQITELPAHISVATWRLLELLREFDEREGWARDGCFSCVHWLGWKCGIGHNAASEKIRVAHALTKLPKIYKAFSTGEVTYSKVRAMTRAATPENEDYLLNIPRHGTASHREKLVRGYRRAERDWDNLWANNRYTRRLLEMYQAEDGMLVVKARLAPEDGERFKAALEALTREMLDEGSADLSAESTLAARRADALVQLASTGADIEVVVHVDAVSLMFQYRRELC